MRRADRLILELPSTDFIRREGMIVMVGISIGRGLLAGVIGTAVMDTSQTALIPTITSWLQSLVNGPGSAQHVSKYPESSGQSGQNGKGVQREEEPLSSPEKVAKRGAELLGVELDRDQIAIWGNRVHWVYGTQWGLVYQIIRPQPGLQSGLLYGAALWLLSDELLLWILNIAKAPTSYPVSTHLQALAAHCIYGSVVGAVTKGLRD